MTNYQTKISAFIVVKSGNFCLRVCHPSLFDWNFFKIGSVSVKDIRKNAPILQVGESSHIPSTLPVVWVVLLHKMAFCQSFISTTVYWGGGENPGNPMEIISLENKKLCGNDYGCCKYTFADYIHSTNYTV